MLARKDTVIRVPVRLINSTTGAGVTGMLPADVSNGTGGSITIVKGDGTTTDIALVNATNWFEISATKAPGLYHIKLLAANTDVLGSLQIAVLPTAGAFAATVATITVESIAAGIEAIPATITALDTEIDALTTSMGVIQPQILNLHDFTFGKWEIPTSGPDSNRLVLYRADGVTVLKKFALQTDLGVPTTLNPMKRIPL